jgi:hypothetical protein
MIAIRAMCGFGLRRAIPTCGAFPSLARLVQESLKRDPHAAEQSDRLVDLETWMRQRRTSSDTAKGLSTAGAFTHLLTTAAFVFPTAPLSAPRVAVGKKWTFAGLTLAAIVSPPSIPCLQFKRNVLNIRGKA